MKRKIVAILSWLMALWMCKVFLSSLPYKFTGHPDTQHIFGTIGAWMSGILGDGIGNLFASVGAYAVGGFELITSLILLLPALLWLMSKIGINQIAGQQRARWHRIGGLLAAVVMSGAVFFHLFTPLGIEVLHQGKSDGGSLFYAAVSILIMGVIMFGINSLKLDDDIE